MAADLNSLRIDKSLKSTPAARSASRWPWVLLVLLLIAGGAFYYLKYASAAVEVSVMPVPAPTTQAAADDDVALNATGYIVAAHKIELAPKVPGKVAMIHVDMGDKVHKGDVLVELEDDEYRARAGQAQGQLDSAKARLEELQNGARPEEIAQSQAEYDQAAADLQNAETNQKRTRQLVGTSAVSDQAIDDADAKAALARARLGAAKAALDLVKAGPRKEQIEAQVAEVAHMKAVLDSAQLDLNETIIRAPIDGTVLERNVERGDGVTTGFVGDRGAKGYVVSLADLNDLKVELDIAQSDFVKTSMGQKCIVTTDAYPDRKYAGVVDQIAPEANRQKATVLVKVKVLTPDELLRPDMNASVAFLRTGATTQSGDASPAEPRGVVIPSSALRDGKLVLVVEDGKAVERPVETAGTTSAGVRIIKGLIGGETLILNPPATLQSGAAVRAKETGADRS